jgi:hypothetical protein
MAEIFDPNNVGNFEAQTAVVDRQRKLADFLRKQVAGQTQPTGEGSMVGGYYVPESASKAIINAAQGYELNQADKQLAAQEDELMKGQQAHAANWRATLPQAIAAQSQQTAPFMAPGMDGEENIPGTSTITQQAQAFQPVAPSVRLKHTLEGMRNPLTAKEAVVWDKGMSEETTREDKQAEARALQANSLAQKAMELKQKSEDARYTAAERLKFQRDMLEAQNQWHALASSDKRYMADALGGARSTAATDRAAERRDDKIRGQVEHIGTRMKDVAPLLVSGQAVQDMFDRYGDKVPDGLGMVGRNTPTGMQPAEWTRNNQAVKALVNSLVRNQAGLSQTLSETQNAQLELIVNGTATGKQFKDSWDAIKAKVNAYPMTIGASFEPEAVELYKSRGGNLEPIMSKAERAAKKATVAPAAGPKGYNMGPAGATNPDGSSVDPRADQIRLIQAERAKATNPQDIIALDRELQRLGVAPAAALPRAAQAIKPNGGWKIEAVP